MAMMEIIMRLSYSVYLVGEGGEGGRRGEKGGEKDLFSLKDHF